MKCCSECFRDIHIRDTIENFGVTGDCDYCLCKEVKVYDTSRVPSDISDAIVSLVQIYDISDLPKAKSLKLALSADWDIFNTAPDIIEGLVKDLCYPVIDPNDDRFTKNVAMPQLSDPDFLHEFGIVRGHSWEKFSESIKYENRFHSDMFNADAFASFLSMMKKQYSAGTEFYRARITSSGAGFSEKEMSAPPKEKRSAGRINPEGIGVLYLSSDDETVLKEVRASTFDFVTIGTFKSTRDIIVANLSGISKTSPFLYEDVLGKYAVNKKILQEIEHDIAKPLRRSDSPLAYLPTQYIAEFIKSLSFDGVEYASTLKNGGRNIAIFDETLFKCMEVKTIEITDIKYERR